MNNNLADDGRERELEIRETKGTIQLCHDNKFQTREWTKKTGEPRTATMATVELTLEANTNRLAGDESCMPKDSVAGSVDPENREDSGKGQGATMRCYSP